MNFKSKKNYIKIDNIKYHIKKISELSVKEYSLIIQSNMNYDILSYLEVFTNQKIKSKEVKSNINLADLQSLIFDLSVDYRKIEKPNIFIYKSNQFLTDELLCNTYQTHYIFDVYRNMYNTQKISIIEFLTYSVAIMLERKIYYKNDFNTDKINEIYENLLNYEWTKILPLGFFLQKKLRKKNNYLMIFLKSLMINFHFLIKWIMKNLKIKIRMILN